MNNIRYKIRIILFFKLILLFLLISGFTKAEFEIVRQKIKYTFKDKFCETNKSNIDTNFTASTVEGKDSSNDEFACVEFAEKMAGLIIKKSSKIERISLNRKKWPENRIRGINLALISGGNIKNDYEKFISDSTFRKLVEWKINLIRVSINVDKGSMWDIEGGSKVPAIPASNKLAPYEKHLKYFEKALNLAEKYKIFVVIAASRIVGRDTGTLKRNKTKWSNYKNFLTDIWYYIANRFGQNMWLIGYDLLNEPVYGRSDFTWRDEIAPHLVNTIRKVDRETSIIIEPGPWGLPKGFNTFKPIGDEDTIYSFHFYSPHNFTHQGIRNRPVSLTYPGFIKNFDSSPELYWDKVQLKNSMNAARNFQHKYRAKIFVGEFSAIRWAPGASKWIEDAISIFEEYGWDWCFHSYGGWNGWNPTFSADDPQNNEYDGGRYTDRLKVLIKFWNKNKY